MVTAGADGEIVIHRLEHPRGPFHSIGHRRVHKGAINSLYSAGLGNDIFSVGDDSSLFYTKFLTDKGDGTNLIQSRLLYRATLPLHLVAFRRATLEGVLGPEDRIYCYGDEMKIIVLDGSGKVLFASSILKKKIKGWMLLESGILTVEEDGRLRKYIVIEGDQLKEVGTGTLALTCKHPISMFSYKQRALLCDYQHGLLALSQADLSFENHIMPPGASNFVLSQIGKQSDASQPDLLLLSHSKGLCIVNAHNFECSPDMNLQGFSGGETIIGLTEMAARFIGFVTSEGNVGCFNLDYQIPVPSVRPSPQKREKIQSNNAALALMYSDEEQAEGGEEPIVDDARKYKDQNTKKAKSKSADRENLFRKYSSRIDSDHSDKDSHNSYDVPSEVEEPAPSKPAPAEYSATPAPVSIHRPFQPGCTSWTGNYRFLAWNDIGTVTSRQDRGYWSIEVEFSDRNFHHPIRFIDEVGYTMAAIGKSGVVFASTPFDSSESHPTFSKLLVNPFSTWTKNPSFQLELKHDDERILGIAIGGTKYCIMATSHGLLRTVSINGLQGPIITFAGEYVTMVAQDDRLLLLTTDSHNNRLFYAIYVLTDFLRLLAQGEVSHRFASSKVIWAGFTPTGQGALFDEYQTLYICDDSAGFLWRPWLDCQIIPEYQNRKFWPVFVSQGDISGIMLEDAEMRPEVTFRPLLTVIPFQIPLLNVSTDPIVKSFEKSIRTRYMLEQRQSTDLDKFSEDRASKKERLEADKHVLELIQLAIRAERLARVMELCEFFLLEKSWDLAIQLIRHNKLPSLANRIEELRESKKSVSSLFEKSGEYNESRNREPGRSILKESSSIKTLDSVFTSSRSVGEEAKLAKSSPMKKRPASSPMDIDDQVDVVNDQVSNSTVSTDLSSTTTTTALLSSSRNLSDIIKSINLTTTKSGDSKIEIKPPKLEDLATTPIIDSSRKSSKKQLSLAKFTKLPIDDENTSQGLDNKY